MATIIGINKTKETLVGGSTDDILIGGAGTNNLYGKGGADIFVMDSAISSEFSSDTIKDFQPGIDKIDVSAFGISSWSQMLSLSQGPGATEFSLAVYYNGVYHGLVIANTQLKSLSADDFIFDATGPGTKTGTDGMDTVLGSAGDDTLIGSGGYLDRLFGGDGNDLLDGRPGGSASLFGGDGDDVLIGNRDDLYGGKGNDILTYQYSTNLTGQSGADTFKMPDRILNDYDSSTSGDIQDFRPGSDKIDVSAFGISSFAQLKLILETNHKGTYFNAYYGADEYNVSNQHEVVIRNVAIDKLTASDFIFALPGAGIADGTNGADRLFGSEAADTLNGKDGYDELFGGGGNDLLIGGRGTNRLYGQGGADIFKVGPRFYTETEGTWDRIGDFQIGVDKVDVSAFGISSFEQLQLIFETRNGKDAAFDAFSSEEFSFGVQFSNVAVDRLTAADFIFDKGGARAETGIRYSERMFGSNKSDRLDGAEGNDELFGGRGNDRLFGGIGNDKLFGGSGNDILSGGFGRDFYHGGDGADLFKTTSMKVESTALVIDDFQVGVDRIDLSPFGISSFDQLQILLETKASDTFFAISYNGRYSNISLRNVSRDELTSADFIYDTRGPKNLTGGRESDYLFGSIEADRLKGDGGHDHLFGGDGNDILDGGSGSDILYGGNGDDTVRGGDGYDTIFIDSGNDKVDGGSGVDTVRFRMRANLDLSRNVTGPDSARYASYINIEYFYGSEASDRMKGDELDNFFYGKTGNDTLSGMGGKDRIEGGIGNDRIDGGVDNDRLYGQSGDDTIDGGLGRDRLSGGAGHDRLSGGLGVDYIDGGAGDDIIVASAGDEIRGGTGIDTVVFTAPVIFDHLGALKNTGEAEGASFYDIEIYDGSNGADIMVGGWKAVTFRGNAGNDQLTGGVSNDVLFGGSGNDRVSGAAGSDALYGGKGADTFLYKRVSESISAAAGRDTIFDFVASEGDRIDLAFIDADLDTSGNQSFSFIGKAAFTGKAGQLRYERASSDTYIYGDINGDGKADLSIRLDDSMALTKGYFLL